MHTMGREVASIPLSINMNLKSDYSRISKFRTSVLTCIKKHKFAF